jgi:peptide/nickel transport system ATP-binding protein
MRRDKAKAATICLHLLEEVGISEPVKKLTAWPHELSGGLAQRVVIAMALARQPKLLIADEPTTALDVTVQAQILDLIARLQERHGFGVLLITHDMGVIRDRADCVAVMDDGVIVESGATLDLFANPKSRAARSLLKASELVFATASGVLHDAASQPPLIEVKALQKTFRNGPRALGGVDISVKAGSTLGIVGESGSGKTTLARIIAGLERADDGHILIDGNAQTTYNMCFRTRIRLSIHA